MRNLSAYIKHSTLLFLLFIGPFMVLACSGGGGGDGGGGSTADGLVMITPYVNESDIAVIYEAYSDTSNAPWGFDHGGIDFFPTEHMKPFQAVFSGTIARLELWQSDEGGEWWVTVRLKHSSGFFVEYVFENVPSNNADGQTQLSNIVVSKGQSVNQGDIIGNLIVTGEETSLVHFGFYKSNGDWLCPEPYFTQEAKDSIVRLVQIFYPGASMCY